MASTTSPQLPKDTPPSYSEATAETGSTNIAGSEAGDTAPMFASPGLTDQAIRRRFIRKVYLILTAQLVVTVIFVAVFQFVQPVKKYVQGRIEILISALVVFFVLYVVLICCKKVRRSFPGNFIALALFTIAFSYMAATVASCYDFIAVLFAAILTMGITLSITLYVLFVKTDFTFLVSLLVVFVSGMLLFCIAAGLGYGYFAPHYGERYGLQSIYGGLMAMLFGLFLAIDTWLVLKSELSEEEYIYAALQLYIDIVYIFLLLLGVRGRN